MVTGEVPQSKVTTPPLVTAAASAASVQLAAVPVPTTVVGVETSAGVTGAGQVAAGGGPASPVKLLVVVPAPVPVVPAPVPAPPVAPPWLPPPQATRASESATAEEQAAR
jgi:hypothetical protein